MHAETGQRKLWSKVIEKIVRPDKYAMKMLRTMENGES